jgi:hypothetical protein
MSFKMKGFKAHDMCSECGSPMKKKGCSPLRKKGPCWSGYEMIGMKKKGGKNVPNCVPKNKK